MEAILSEIKNKIDEKYASENSVHHVEHAESVLDYFHWWVFGLIWFKPEHRLEMAGTSSKICTPTDFSNFLVNLKKKSFKIGLKLDIKWAKIDLKN